MTGKDELNVMKWKIYITPIYVIENYIQNAQKIKSRRSELVSDFCDFFQIFPVQAGPVLMLFLTYRTFPWCSCSVPGYPGNLQPIRNRPPPEAYETPPPGMI